MSKTTLTDEWGLFTAIPNEFIEQSSGLSDHARWMFILLRFYTNAKTGTAFPSYEELKSRTGWAYNTIAKAVKELESTGWLTRRKQFSGSTHYTLVKKSHSLLLARNGENDQSLLMTSPCESQGQSLPLASTVLANSKPNKTEITKTEITKREPTPDRLTISDALEDIYPGHATDIRLMNQLRDLVNRVDATPDQILAFPAWLAERYPTKANGPFAFKDLFPGYVKSSPSVNGNGNEAAKTATADRCTNCGGAGKSVRRGPDRFKPGQLLETCPICNGTGTTTTGAHHVSSTNRNRVTA